MLSKFELWKLVIKHTWCLQKWWCNPNEAWLIVLWQTVGLCVCIRSHHEGKLGDGSELSCHWGSTADGEGGLGRAGPCVSRWYPKNVALQSPWLVGGLAGGERLLVHKTENGRQTEHQKSSKSAWNKGPPGSDSAGHAWRATPVSGEEHALWLTACAIQHLPSWVNTFSYSENKSTYEGIRNTVL